LSAFFGDVVSVGLDFNPAHVLGRLTGRSGLRRSQTGEKRKNCQRGRRFDFHNPYFDREMLSQCAWFKHQRREISLLLDGLMGFIRQL
jgi:hypothetical protein